MAALAQKRKVSAPRRKSRRNPAGAAAEMFEKFTGLPSSGYDEYVEYEKYHSELEQLGILRGLKVRTVAGKDIEIEFAEGTMADLVSNPKQNPWWPFDGSFNKTTIYHVKTGAKHSSSAKHKGYTIYKAADGTFMVPALDRESHMDTAKDAKKFIDAWSKKNPGPIRAAWKGATTLVGSVTSKGPIADAQKAGGKVLDYVDGKIGKAFNGKRKNPHGLTLLAANERFTQLYFQGGSQELDLKSMKIPERDSVVVGEAWLICYNARKSFDDFKDLDYVHGFGSEEAHPRLSKKDDLWEDAEPPEDLFGTGDLPTVRYDNLNAKLYLDGGVYKIHNPMFGVSDGIID